MCSSRAARRAVCARLNTDAHNAHSLHFVETALFARGADRAAESAGILVREFARRDKVPLQFTLLHLLKVARLESLFSARLNFGPFVVPFRNTTFRGID